MSRPTLDERVRVYTTVRTAHLERAKQLTPATILYRGRRYDFDEDVARGVDLVHASPLRSALLLLTSTTSVVEINEPLMLSSLAGCRLALLALTLRRIATGRRARVVTYAIENADPFAGPAAGGVRAAVRRRLQLALARGIARRVDRIAYGTSAAALLYEQRLPELVRATARIVPALPAARTVPGAKRPGSVVFLGAFAERKGLPVLLAAWDSVRAAQPEATLTLLGKGALEGEAHRFAADRPEVRVLVDPPRDRIFAELDAAQVLVLPSQPRPSWREQVGLPIVEGLSAGCSIVTTAETGLASWLADHGHAVVTDPDDAAALAAAIGAQVALARPADDVLADLPVRDGRLAADDWLFQREDAHP